MYYAELKSLIWAFTFGICIAYMLIGAIEFIIEKIQRQKMKKQFEKALILTLKRIAREQAEQEEKQEFLKSINY